MKNGKKNSARVSSQEFTPRKRPLGGGGEACLGPDLGLPRGKERKCDRRAKDGKFKGRSCSVPVEREGPKTLYKGCPRGEKVNAGSREGGKRGTLTGREDRGQGGFVQSTRTTWGGLRGSQPGVWNASEGYHEGLPEN